MYVKCGADMKRIKCTAPHPGLQVVVETSDVADGGFDGAVFLKLW
jgi:hypothetical protein